MGKKISIYLKSGPWAATPYYRFYSYFKDIDVDVRYHLQIPDNLYKKIMPISQKAMPFQIAIFAYIYQRVLWQLITDVFYKPKCVLISRRLINRFFPNSYRLLLCLLKKRGSKIIWDIDDQIIETKEISMSGLEFMAKNSDRIIIASDNLKDMIQEKYRNKVQYLPSTDQEPYIAYGPDIRDSRIKSLEDNIILLWVGSSSSQTYVEAILPSIERAGITLRENKKSVTFVYICDKKLAYHAQNFLLVNLKWDRTLAIKYMLNAHIGLMPLENNGMTKGKGGLKLIQYLSCALPIIGSSVGINSTIINGKNGVAVTELDNDEWYNAIIKITRDRDVWLDYSDEAIKSWEMSYSFKSNVTIWNNIICSL